MQFSSGVFLMLFLPLTMVVYKIGGMWKGQRYKNSVLLIASLIFYGWGEPLFIFVLLFGIVLNYYIGILIEERREKKFFLMLSIAVNVGIIFVFKYLTFVVRELSKITPIKEIDIALPIGISFYTFQIMGYVFDVYYGKTTAQRNIFDLTLYISMFPQLVAGPIVRYSDVEAEIRSREETRELFYQGTRRFVIGLSKKVLLADFLGGIADKIFITAESSEISLVTAWVGAIAYTFEIYYDFSGYSDMAIGLGKCFGFHFKENFNYPYISCSISEFWKRWHISLTDWFRDYVYIPLGGSRVSARRHVLNLFTVWLLTGIWHGAEWTFILWGLYHFALQLFEKKASVTHKIPKQLGYVVTMLEITIGWVLFKATNLNSAISYLSAMLGLGGGIVDNNALLYVKSSAVILLISYIGAFPIAQRINDKLHNKYLRTLKELIAAPLFAALLGFCLFTIISGTYSPFIYFNF